jgi:hypothetical protein
LADQTIIVKTYAGKSLEVATAAYQVDAPRIAASGYVPTSQTWAPGEYGCGSFIGALILCFILVGIFVFLYMLIVKPDGTLTVTYELRAIPVTSVADGLPIEAGMPAAQRRPCPYCAELILPAARVCRFCSRELPEGWAGEVSAPVSEPVTVHGAFEVGARVKRTPSGAVGEVIAIEGEAITVRWPDNRSSTHLRRDLRLL